MSNSVPKPIRVLIADDESTALRRLQHFLAQEADIELVAQCRDGKQAVEQILSLKPDIVFLDVEMPEMDGIEVVQHIGINHMPVTIFATAYGHYALPAFESNVLDFLLKPFDRERFAKALQKARTWLQAGQQQSQLQAVLQTVLQERGKHETYLERILVRNHDSQQLLRVADITYICAERNYIRIHTSSASYLQRDTMQNIMQRLNPATFRRIHRSHIVNLDHVDKLLPWYGGDFLLMLKDGGRLTVSRGFRGALRGLGSR